MNRVQRDTSRWSCYLWGVIACFAFFSSPCLLAQEGEPRHPGIVHFEEIGRLPAAFWPLGDINGDGIGDGVTAYPLDTCLESWQCGQELRIHYGVQGSLPNLAKGIRLAPDYLVSKSEVVAVGDWDGENGLDICTYSLYYGDTTFGNADRIYDGTGVMLIHWNDGTGKFPTTSRLFPPTPGSFAARGVTIDANNNGVDDLCLYGSNLSRQDTGIAKIPRLFIYKGKPSTEWQYEANFPDWYWWNAPNDVDRIYAKDLDHDKAQDLILSANNANSPLVVLYGRKDGNFPDTITDKQQITINGLASNFSDVTGDNYADLVILNSAQDFVYCYVSTPSARRLQDMFGTGNDPPRAGEWWSRPWATLKGPRLVNQFWFGLEASLYPLGSADTSAPDEIWVKSWPYILVYQTGMRLDSLIDAEIDTRTVRGTPVRLGDIDGDGRDELAMVWDETTIFRLPDALPSTVLKLRRLPEGTDKPDSASGVEEQGTGEERRLGLSVYPHPASGEVTIAWNSRILSADTQTIVQITDMLGQEVLRLEVPASLGHTVWDASRTFGGVYFVTVTAGSISQTEQITIQQ